ncbi:hypothetical protein E2C01_038161 [Portunus trituberculatus]|uniref:Uncharacterized protein n=1 Tax=Portunus trituberculatus TaxID=210409 RepID=A0A5B7FHS7_PORTR|nr:hypothetical protein [Portunus trituberculatus]
MSLGGDMGPNMGTTINKIARVANTIVKSIAGQRSPHHSWPSPVTPPLNGHRRQDATRTSNA